MIVDQQEVVNARKQAGPFDIDGITGARVELKQLSLRNQDGSTLPLAKYVDAVTVEVDNETRQRAQSMVSCVPHGLNRDYAAPPRAP